MTLKKVKTEISPTKSQDIEINPDRLTWTYSIPGFVIFHIGGQKFSFKGTLAEFKIVIGIP